VNYDDLMTGARALIAAPFIAFLIAAFVIGVGYDIICRYSGRK